MFKNSVESIEHDDTIVNDVYFWMRTVWEHGM